MVIFKLPKMTKQEMWKLIRRQRLCARADAHSFHPRAHVREEAQAKRVQSEAEDPSFQ
jgi:hypothetical protein